jgi:carboxymethylenebutenolidase
MSEDRPGTGGGAGRMVSFPVNGTEAGGYLAQPAGGPAAGVLVLQEWWGLVPQIKAVCDRMAEAGFTALAPDLYHGEIAEHTEMDKAGELMTGLPPERAARDMSGAIDFLLADESTVGAAVGVTGFCMGGMLTLVIAAREGDRVAAAAPFYGAPLGDGAPDWSGLTASVEGHFAENDDFFAVPAVKELEATLRGLGKDATFHIYPGTGHGFTNEEDPLGTYDPDATAVAWDRLLAHLRAHL